MSLNNTKDKHQSEWMENNILGGSQKQTGAYVLMSEKVDIEPKLVR
jgi:hypothetical protein